MKFNLFGLITILPGLMMNAEAREVSETLTHTANISMSLVAFDQKGREDRLESRDGEFELHWAQKRCEAKFENIRIPCTLDYSNHLKNRSGEVLMFNAPQVHFDQAALDRALLSLGREARATRKVIDRIVSETSCFRIHGFTVPFYSCVACDQPDGDAELMNVYDDGLTSALSVNHPYGKYLLRITLKNMKPVKGAFNIIGSSNASDFGH